MPKHHTISTQGVKNDPNALLQFTKIDTRGNTNTKTFNLWVTHVAQDNQLRGITAQSLHTRHFYPRAYGPGDYQIIGVMPNQEMYQNLAVYIRDHQEYMLHSFQINTTVVESRKVLNYIGTMTLKIPSEQINLEGWINYFSITKLGVFEPAPVYEFNFTVARDQDSNNAQFSNQMKRVYGGKDVIDKKILKNWKKIKLT